MYHQITSFKAPLTIILIVALVTLGLGVFLHGRVLPESAQIIEAGEEQTSASLDSASKTNTHQAENEWVGRVSQAIEKENSMVAEGSAELDRKIDDAKRKIVESSRLIEEKGNTTSEQLNEEKKAEFNSKLAELKARLAEME